ncbi:glutathione S-transferase family protein [Teredinibacter purpureus]|uniref:glutathione S-transferase family protein n=1 Tax=Teredinibacter purpureus TaxID=2731756 RepID=UPI0005F7F107|nr:glutathione S-transferase family protein [Teredinibacter purpureus]
MKVYGDSISGNCYKIQLVCALLDIPYTWVPLNILKGEAQAPEFLEKTPNGKIPLLVLGDGRCLSESNAIVNFLAAGSALLPEDAFLLAKTQQWQFFEQYSHEPYIAVRRFIQLYQGLPETRKAEYESKKAGSEKALKVMEQQLAHTAFLVSDSPTVADISLFAYTHRAHEAGLTLTHYPNIQRWINSIEKLPNFRPMRPKG